MKRELMVVQGDKAIATQASLLDEFHTRFDAQDHGIDPQPVRWPWENEDGECVFRCVVTTPHGTYSATGVANKRNTKPNMQQHIIPLAETRSVVRALRYAVGWGGAAEEEMDGDEAQFVTSSALDTQTAVAAHNASAVTGEILDVPDDTPASPRPLYGPGVYWPKAFADQEPQDLATRQAANACLELYENDVERYQLVKRLCESQKCTADKLGVSVWNAVRTKKLKELRPEQSAGGRG